MYRFLSSKHNKSYSNTYINEESDNEDRDDYSEIKIVDNNIYFFTDVNRDTILELTLAIKEVTKHLQIMNIKYNIEIPYINIYINSEGGEVHAALSVFDVIQNNPIEIKTIITGNACSAATIISLAGHQRTITENSYMLIHNISSSFWGKMHEFEDEMKNLAKLTTNLKRIYKKHSSINQTQLNSLLKKDILIDSKTCLKYGMVDMIE